MLAIAIPSLAIFKGLFEEFGYAVRQAARLPHHGTQTQAANNVGLSQQPPQTPLKMSLGVGQQTLCTIQNSSSLAAAASSDQAAALMSPHMQTAGNF